jgi:hypothetical protein
MSQQPPSGNPLGSGPGVNQGAGGPPPVPLGYAAPVAAPATDIRKIATMQRTIMFCILAELFVMVARGGAFASGMMGLAMVTFLLYLAVVIIACVCIFVLAMSLYSPAVGVLLGILALVPIIGLIVLLVVNGKATKVLREHGLKVGLMGAKLPPLSSP